MSTINLGEVIEWNLVLRQSLVAQRTNNPLEHIPLSPITAISNSNIMAVGCSSPDRKPTWWLGCWIKFGVLVSPSTTSQFSAFMEFFSQPCGLDRLTVAVAPKYQPIPYVIRVEIPRWIPSLNLEVWRYDAEP